MTVEQLGQFLVGCTEFAVRYPELRDEYGLPR